MNSQDSLDPHDGKNLDEKKSDSGDDEQPNCDHDKKSKKLDFGSINPEGSLCKISEKVTVDNVVACTNNNSQPQSSLENKRKTVGDSQGNSQSNLKRRKKCPTKDFILIEVPINVTADLGVALRRTRRKRGRRIHKWVNNVMSSCSEESIDKTMRLLENGGNVTSSETNNDVAEGDDGKESIKTTAKVANPANEVLLDEESNDGMPKREQYGSVLDYLEAKYVRGVMIADYDERVRAKKKMKDMKKGENGQGVDIDSNDGDDSDDDGKGSCYEDDDGDFLDDSLLHEEVADQVLASSSYGKTRIEEEASKRKKRKRDKSSDGGKVGLDVDGNESHDDEKFDNLSDEGVDSDFDDGFFVNIGDLEMAEGWKGDEDVVIAPSKKAKKGKRSGGGKTGRQKGSSKKIKMVENDGIIVHPNRTKQENPREHKSTTFANTDKKKKVDCDKAAGKLKQTKKEAKANAASTPYQEKKQQKKTGPISTPKPDKDIISHNCKKKKSLNSPKPDKATKLKSKKNKSPKLVPKPETPKEKVARLKKLTTRKYNLCVKMIKELTSEELPAKKKTKKSVKVSVNIPPDLSAGDQITFE
ncbi:hypothetical protein ACHAXS_001365 [Conticribra weissflogii]